MFQVTECVKISCFGFKSLLAGVSKPALSPGAPGIEYKGPGKFWPFSGL